MSRTRTFLVGGIEDTFFNLIADSDHATAQLIHKPTDEVILEYRDNEAVQLIEAGARAGYYDPRNWRNVMYKHAISSGILKVTFEGILRRKHRGFGCGGHRCG